MHTRRAFTLIELLVVISIIAILAAISVPAAGAMRRAAKSAECQKNLQGIGTAIIAYRDHGPYSARDVRFPGRLAHMIDAGEIAAGDIVCPADLSAGKDRKSGRPSGSAWDNHEKILAATTTLSFNAQRFVNGQSITATAGDTVDAETYPISYFYECSDEQRNDFDMWPYSQTGLMWVPSRPWSEIKTWGQYKREQKMFGNFEQDNSGNIISCAWNSSVFPLVRCYHHFPWTAASRHLEDKHANNVAWDGTTFKTSPYWEYDANPTYFTPPP